LAIYRVLYNAEYSVNYELEKDRSNMNISPEEAQQALASIQQTKERLRKGYGYYGYYGIIWGFVWLVGFLASQFLTSRPAVIGWTWGILVLAGWISSAWLGMHQATYVRSVIGARLGLFFLALFAFAILWFIILPPLSGKLYILLFVTLIFFGGVVSGVFSRSVLAVISCVSLTVISLIGYYLVPGYFYLWMAIFGGLSMFCFGLYVRLRWR
jgi:hypothetical protein